MHKIQVKLSVKKLKLSVITVITILSSHADPLTSQVLGVVLPLYPMTMLRAQAREKNQIEVGGQASLGHYMTLYDT